ncbi:MAG: septum site-determining protein MinD [Clostridia bacterium]|nr:septum site-determining protein MinD [Clostridia bacterium]
MNEALLITSGKGGVGKSTLAVNLAATLALMGHAVVLVDADTGLRSLDMMLGLENDVVYDLTDVAEGVCKLRQAIVPVPSVLGLRMVAASALRDTGSVSRGKMREIIGELKERFYVVIDCPAGVDEGFRIAASGAERAIIVTQNDPVCARDAERVKGLLERAGVTDVMLVVNHARRERLKRGETSACERLAERLDLPLLGVIGENDAFRIAAQKGCPLVLKDKETEQTFEAIARRLQGESLPLKPLGRLTLWQWLKKDYRDD